MACSANCATQDHATWGECIKAKNLKIEGCASWKGHDRTRIKKGDKDLDAYADARRQGVQPKSTRRFDTEMAMKVSNETGVAFQA
jgi:hypothetical protein